MVIFEEIVFFLFFCLCTLFSFYIPGELITNIFWKKKTTFSTLFLPWIIGYSLFIFSTYLFEWAKLPIGYLLILVGLLFIWIYKKSWKHIVWIRQIDTVSVVIIALGSFAFVSMSFFSGWMQNGAMQFIGTVNGTDGVIHLSRITSQLIYFPPMYSGFAGYLIHGYNYFYDLLLSRFSYFFHFSPEDLYFRFFPITISLFYGGSMYVFSTLMVKEKITRRLILFFSYFAQSFAFLLSFFIHSVSVVNGMGLVQPIELILDPSTILAISMLLGGFYVILSSKKSAWQLFLGACVIGLLAELKIYAGFIGMTSLLCLSLWQVIYKKEKKRQYILACLGAAILTFVTYAPNNAGVGGFIFNPFFLYSNFLKQPLFSFLHWDAREMIYLSHHNIPHLMIGYLEGFMLFWILTLGSRIVLLLGSLSLFKKTFWQKDENILLCLLIGIPLLLTMFFVQSISIFDTVQFLWIVGVLVSIPSGIVLGNVFHRVPKTVVYVSIVLLIFCSTGGVLFDAKRYLIPQKSDTLVISKQELYVLRVITLTTPKYATVVVLPTKAITNGESEFQYYPAPLIAALSGRESYYEYEIPQVVPSNALYLRKQTIEAIFTALKTCNVKKVSNEMKTTKSVYLVTQSKTNCKGLPAKASSDALSFFVLKN